MEVRNGRPPLAAETAIRLRSAVMSAHSHLGQRYPGSFQEVSWVTGARLRIEGGAWGGACPCSTLHNPPPQRPEYISFSQEFVPLNSAPKLDIVLLPRMKGAVPSSANFHHICCAHQQFSDD